jgi:putative ABC transport system permease protein
MRIPPAVRSLLRDRALSIAVILTLSLGLGSLTVTFGLLDAAVLRPPPFGDADRLAILYITRTRPGRAMTLERWSFARIQLLRSGATSFQHVANYSTAELNLTGTDDPEPVNAEVVSPGYFPTLRVSAVQGRVFTDDEDKSPGAHPVALVGYDLWQRRYAGRPDIVGSTVGVNGVALTIVGVLPKGFTGLTGKAQLWVPTTMAPSLSYADYLTTNQNFISVVGRLAPHVDLARARSELAILGADIQRVASSSVEDSTESLGAVAMSLNEARVDRRLKRSVFVLAGAVALLHLLACANVANLLLGRASRRRREMAIRVALGCGRSRLLGHLFGEGLLLTIGGGILGVVVAWNVLALLQAPESLVSPGNMYGSLAAFARPAPDAALLLFAASATLVTALLIAWAPAASLARLDVVQGLREGARGVARGAARFRRPGGRGAIVTAEAALAVLLLIAGGLMIESWARIRATRLGIDPSHLLTFSIRPSEVRVPQPVAPAFIARILSAIGQVPGVEAATVDGCTPLGRTCANTVVQIIGRPELPNEKAPPVLRHYVGPDHFRALGVPLLRGRTFTATDVAGQPHVAIVSAATARRFWPNADAVGQRVWFGGGASAYDYPDSSAAIVGIVGDAVYQPPDEYQYQGDFYTPYGQFTYASRSVMVRTRGDPIAALPAVRAAVRAVDPDLPLYDVRTMDERVGATWAKRRFDALMLSAFATLALLLAASGIYAVVAHAVGERTREMGIRVALGATPRAVVALVVRQGMVLPAMGLGVGVAGALAVTRLLRASLYEVTPTDPAVFAATVALLLLCALVACLVPARRATRADPLEAMRAE